MRKSQSLAVLAALGLAAAPLAALAQDASSTATDAAQAGTDAETGSASQMPDGDEPAPDAADAGMASGTTGEGADGPASRAAGDDMPADAAADPDADADTRMNRAAPADVPTPTSSVLTADLIGTEGSVIGKTTLTSGPNGLLLEVSVQEGGLPPGWHGLHLHQVGDCSDTGSFTRSGGHVGKIEGGHGLLNPDGPEAGDLPNLYVHADGSAVMEAFTNLARLQDLADEDGTALILHEARDDHRSQPIGGAGGRIACAAIVPQRP